MLGSVAHLKDKYRLEQTCGLCDRFSQFKEPKKETTMWMRAHDTECEAVWSEQTATF